MLAGVGVLFITSIITGKKIWNTCCSGKKDVRCQLRNVRLMFVEEAFCTLAYAWENSNV